MTAHGTTTAYTTGRCRCDDCTAAGTLQYKRWQRAAARSGGRVTVPSGDARRQLAEIRRATGWGWMRLSVVLGLAPSSAHRIACRATRVHVRTADRIGALWQDYCGPVDPAPRRYPVGPLLDAMAAAGVSQREMERRVGVDVAWTRPTVTCRVADAAAVALHTHIDLIWTETP